MIYITSMLQIFIILLYPTEISTQNDFKINSFELKVQNEGNLPVENYDLTKVTALHLQPNTRFNFKCRVSRLPSHYVVITYKNKFNRTDQLNNITNSLEAEYRIETVDCHHSGNYTCRAGNNKGFKSITTNIVIKCAVTEAKFVSNKKNHFVAISIDQEDISIICEETDQPNSLTLFHLRNRSHRLNYVEQSNQIIYNIPKVTCFDMGTYVCVVNRTNSHQFTSDTNVNVTEKKMDLSVNNCPPQLCDKAFGNVSKTLEFQTNISLTVCVEVSINTRVFVVSYHGSWVSNGTCGKKICLDSKIQNGSRFQRYLNVTLININTTLVDDIIIKIGSGYNFRNNYIYYTICFNKTRYRSTTPLSEVTTSTEMTSTQHQSCNASEMHASVKFISGETQMNDNKDTTWNTVLIFLCVFLLLLTMSLAVVVHFYRSKVQKFRRRPSRISQRLKFLTRNRHSPRIAENSISNEHKLCHSRTDDVVYENTSQQNQYVNNGVKTFYVEPEPANNIYNNVHPIDYGRYINEDGLVYVTVHNSEHVIPPKDITRNQRRKVSYTEIDHNKHDKAETTSDDSTCEGEELIYHNINGVF